MYVLCIWKKQKRTLKVLYYETRFLYLIKYNEYLANNIKGTSMGFGVEIVNSIYCPLLLGYKYSIMATHLVVRKIITLLNDIMGDTNLRVKYNHEKHCFWNH